MNKYLKEFLVRGLVFSGLGPVILGIVYLILGATVDGFSLSGSEVFWGILSIYLLAFVQAGASVFNQIEHWPIAKSTFFHFCCLYLAYSLCYVANSWIPFDPRVLLIFTLAFIALYFLIWITVYITIKTVSKKLNGNLN